MSIEALLSEVRDALNRNTEALLGAAKTANGTAGQTGDKSETKTTATRTKTEKKDEPKITQDQVNAALIKIKDEFGFDEAKLIIKEVGKVEKMGEIKAAQYQAVFDAAVAKYDELKAGANGDAGNDDL